MAASMSDSVKLETPYPKNVEVLDLDLVDDRFNGVLGQREAGVGKNRAEPIAAMTEAPFVVPERVVAIEGDEVEGAAHRAGSDPRAPAHSSPQEKHRRSARLAVTSKIGLKCRPKAER